MSDLFGRLAQRVLSKADVVRPRIAPRYGSDPAREGMAPMEIEVFKDQLPGTATPGEAATVEPGRKEHTPTHPEGPATPGEAATVETGGSTDGENLRATPPPPIGPSMSVQAHRDAQSAPPVRTGGSGVQPSPAPAAPAIVTGAPGTVPVPVRVRAAARQRRPVNGVDSPRRTSPTASIRAGIPLSPSPRLDERTGEPSLEAGPGETRPDSERPLTPRAALAEVRPGQTTPPVPASPDVPASIRPRTEPPPPPAIRVTIGRIGVRAVQPPPPPVTAPAARRRPRMSLDDYLEQRHEGTR